MLNCIKCGRPMWGQTMDPTKPNVVCNECEQVKTTPKVKAKLYIVRIKFVNQDAELFANISEEDADTFRIWMSGNGPDVIMYRDEKASVMHYLNKVHVASMSVKEVK